MGETFTRLGDCSPECRRSFDPLADDLFRVGKRFLIGRAIRHAPRKFGNLCHKRIVFLAPENDNFVFVLHRRLQQQDYTTTPAACSSRVFGKFRIFATGYTLKTRQRHIRCDGAVRRANNALMGQRQQWRGNP